MWEERYGPLLLHERIDAAAALICFVVAKAGGLKREGGGDFTPTDFLPTWGRDIPDDVDDSYETFLALKDRLKGA